MRVTLAVKHRQPRANCPERCDNCLGLEIMEKSVPVSTEPSGDVQLWNVLIPGLGTESFHLHPACADYMRGKP